MGQRPDQGRAPRQDGQRWLVALRALEELERELGAYVSPHHEAFGVAVSKGGGKGGRRRFRLWREMNRLDDAQVDERGAQRGDIRHARASGLRHTTGSQLRWSWWRKSDRSWRCVII